MTRIRLIGGVLLVVGCGGAASTDGNEDDAGIDDAGPVLDANICDTFECECDEDDDCAEHEVCDSRARHLLPDSTIRRRGRRQGERFSMPPRWAATISAR
ncbi:MAG: hypothetical protein JRE82_09965 [Deltaproteobacteria bacterium]|nr:hypothetical protein [Deltaproteobacteria bacterium]